MKVLVNIWVYFWAYTFIIAGLIGKGLDRIGDGINRLLDQDWFAGLVAAANIAIALRVMGVL